MAGVKAGGEGGEGVPPVGRVATAPHGARVQSAATAETGTGRRRPPERGASQGEGSSRQRRQREGQAGAPAGRGASRSEGSNRQRRRKGDRPVGRVRRLAERRSRRATTAAARTGAGAPAGRRVHRPGPPGVLSPMPVLRRGSGKTGSALRTSAAPRLLLPASSKPRSPPHHPLPGYPEWPTRASRKNKSDISPHLCPSPGSDPLLCGLADGMKPRSPAQSAPVGPSGAYSGPGCAPRNHRGALAVRRVPLLTITLCICPGQRGAAVSGTAGPDTRATRARQPRPLPAPTTPALLCRTRPTGRSPLPAFAACSNPAPWGAALGRPADTPSRLRRPLEPQPREVPRPAGTPDHTLTSAVAARLDLRSAGRRTRATTLAPPLPLPSPPA